MVETRRSSSSSKRTFSSPSSSTAKRSKVSEDASPSTLHAPGTISRAKDSETRIDSRQSELRSADLPDTASLKPVDDCVEDKPPFKPVQVEDLVSPQYPGESAPDADKSKAARTAAGRSKKRVTKSTKPVPKAVWGNLLSQCSQNPHLSMFDPIFTVGQGRQCNLWLKDPSVGNVLCKLSHIERGGSSVALLEITGGKGAVQVNGKTHRKNVRQILSGGDEVVFGSSGKHAYIFQPLMNNITTTGIPSSMSNFEAKGAPVDGIKFVARSGDSSAVAGASILATLSDLHNDLSLLSPAATTGKNVQQNTGSSSPSGHGDDIPDNEMKATTSSDEPPRGVSAEKTVLASSNSVNENPRLDTMEVDANVDADAGKITASSELRSLLRMLSGSCPELDLSSSVSKILKERWELRKFLKDVDTPTILASTKHQAFNDSLQQRILTADNIDVSFENFPYYLSDTTKNVLTASTYIHLKCDGFGKYASDLPSVSPQILLSGPAGTEIYQETLCKALAKHFGAKILIVDALSIPDAAPSKEVDSAKESSRPQRPSVFAKRSIQVAKLLQKKPASSVDAEIIGGSTLSSQATLKQEVSTASSKGSTLKTGDRVKFVGNFPSDVSSLQSNPSR